MSHFCAEFSLFHQLLENLPKDHYVHECICYLNVFDYYLKELFILCIDCDCSKFKYWKRLSSPVVPNFFLQMTPLASD